MAGHVVNFLLLLALVAPMGLPTTSAAPLIQPLPADSPLELINAVNALRASHGLAPYSINSILMNTAQAQADFMATTEDVTHSGPGGIGLTDRLLAAGYPLAGDLSAGGFRAENITSGNESRTAESAVAGWAGDALHLNTMISPDLSEIGAGVAIANGRVYYVIDCALPTTGGQPHEPTSVPGSGTIPPARETPVSAAIVSTPNSNGEVIHEVKPGQSLWQLAMAYEVKIDDIKRLNNLFDDDIFPGSKLLIKQHVVRPTASLTPLPASRANIASTTLPESATPTALPTVMIIWNETNATASINDQIMIGVALGIIALALLGGVVFTRLGSKKNTDR